MTGEVLAAHERVVVKPDRSAGGHGLHFVTRSDDRTGQPSPPADSRWVVEQYVDHTKAISAQGHVTASRVEVTCNGKMRTVGGSTDRPVGGLGWRYAALAPHPTRLAELEVRLAAALGP